MRRRDTKIWAGLGLLLAGVCACGGQKGTLTVKIKTPPGAEDPFLGANQVRMTIGDKVSTAAVSGGHFELKIDVDSPSKDDYVKLLVEALDAGNQVVGRGRTPNFVLLAQNSEITVFVGRPGHVTPTEVRLLDDQMQTAGRVGLAGAALRGRQVSPVAERALGVVVVGGSDAAGNSQKSAWLYDPLTHGLLPSGSALKARRGAALVPSTNEQTGQQAILWGGAVTAGGAESDTPTAAEVFDPAMSSLTTVFQAPSMEVADAAGPGAVAPTVAEVKSGIFLVSGGRDRKMDPTDVLLNQAVLLQRFDAPEMAEDRSPRPGVRRIPTPMGRMGPMLAARYQHSATPVTLIEGPGLLLFGGQAAGDAQPVAELFSLNRGDFRELALQVMGGAAPPSRKGHVAAALKDGRVLIAGGVVLDQGMPVVVDSALFVDPRNGQVTVAEHFLSVPRQDASLSLVGDELVLCGGTGDDRTKPLGTCEFFGVDGAARTRDPQPMPSPRAGHVALLLETDQLLLIGGIGDGGQLPSSIDLYTPPR